VRTPGRRRAGGLRAARRRFNPRPGADTGATQVDRGNAGRAGVSIRAPVRTPGRLPQVPMWFVRRQFQSAPRCGHRGDSSASGIAYRTTCFNPRPGADTGATLLYGMIGRDWDVSIRAPVRTPGRHFQFRVHARSSGFQSAPRCGHRGDAPCGLHQRQRILFQSAPRCGHRGDG